MKPALRSRSDVYHLLREERRRDLLREVDRRDGWVGVEELADALADEDRPEGAGTTPDTVREYLEDVDLVQFYDREVLEYDIFDERVRPGAYFATLLGVVEAVDEVLENGQTDERHQAERS